MRQQYSIHFSFPCIHCLLPIAYSLLIPTLSKAQKDFTLYSPDARTTITMHVADRLEYEVAMDGATILARSPLALTIDDKQLGIKPRLLKTDTLTVRRDWRPAVKQKFAVIADNYNERTLRFDGQYDVRIRAYNNGVAYRFITHFNKPQVTVQDETVRLNLPTADGALWAIEDSMFSHNERQFKNLKLSDVSTAKLASLPVLISLPNGAKALFSESDVQDYAGLWITGTGEQAIQGAFPRYPKSEVMIRDRDMKIGGREAWIALTAGERTYPWRALLTSRNDGELLTNTLIAQLAEPSRIADPSWIKPGKVSWDWWNYNNIDGVDFRAGVNTATYKYFIDFAATAGLQYIILDEGWSVPSNVLAAVPEVNMEELLAYAKQKNVGVILWVLWNALDRDLIPALDLYQKWGVKGVKIDFMQRDDQKMIQYYWKVASEAAKRKLLVDYHGAHKPDGLYITYPNVITNEGVFGMENAKWDSLKNIGPLHNVTIPFTRMVTGPMDYTPGAMLNAQKSDWVPIFNRPMSLGTRCHQLAMYVVYESPLQMLADAPSNYLREKECMEFISPVPSVWEQTVPLASKVAEYVSVARRAENGDWYIGAMTNWTERKLTLPTDFLQAGSSWKVMIWQDGINADRNANDFKRKEITIRAGESIDIQLAPGGGWAARLVKSDK